MTRPRPAPVASYAPELLDWLIRGAGAELRLRPTTDEERRRLPQRVLRLRMLQKQLAAEQHDAAALVARVTVRIDRETGDLVIDDRDRGLGELAEVLPAGRPTRKVAAARQPESPEPDDLLAEFASPTKGAAG